jgi:hypothetical protein
MREPETKEPEEREWEEYDARILNDSPFAGSIGSRKQFETESFEPSMGTFRESGNPFLFSHEGSPAGIAGSYGAAETENLLSEMESESSELESQMETEPSGSAFGYGFGHRRSFDQTASEALSETEAEYLIDPYAPIRPAMAPEHASLSANELTVILGGRPAALVLHQLVHSPQMRMATLAGLLGRGARRSVPFQGRNISIPAYLRLVSRLCQEAAEHAEAGSETGTLAREAQEYSEYEGAPSLSASVGRGGVNRPSDVKLVQRLINAHLPVPIALLVEDGAVGPKTIFAIETYQRRTLGMNPPDGRVDPGGATFRSLTGGAVAPPSPLPAPAPKSPSRVGTFPPDVTEAAQASHVKWNIPASVTLAQWAVESYWGTKMPKDSNNPFGIKAVGDQPYVEAHTREEIKGESVTIVAHFRRFDSIADAFDQHGKLLATAKPYARARTFANDPDAFADALTGVYATDHRYGAILKSRMKQYNLYQYD